MSLQIIGEVGSDYEVLRIAEAIEALIDWDNSIVSVPSAVVSPRQIA
jgi:Asp-tRNA(Asn)/Glu-tRNA(Gln) amidotransferase A subunit family amidase